MPEFPFAAQRSRRPNFDRVSRLYRWAEYLALGPLLRRTREQFLPRLTETRRALLLGDGDGRFAAALLRRAPPVRVHAVDSSGAMLQLLQQRCDRAGAGARLTVQQGDVLEASAPKDCDLIVTHFVLDCLTQAEVETLVLRLAQQVSPPCRWLVSEFGLPRPRLARLAAALYLRLLYLAFRLLTGLRVQQLPHPAEALRAAGFECVQRIDRLGGFLYSELWQLAPPVILNAVGDSARSGIESRPGSASSM